MQKVRSQFLVALGLNGACSKFVNGDTTTLQNVALLKSKQAEEKKDVETLRERS